MDNIKVFNEKTSFGQSLGHFYKLVDRNEHYIQFLFIYVFYM